MKYKARWKKQRQGGAGSAPPAKQGVPGAVLARYRWEHVDPVRPEYWTAYCVTVHGPSYEHARVDILYSMSNGAGKCFCRYLTLESLTGEHTVPADGVERLQQAVTRGETLLETIRRDLRFLAAARDLPPGAGLARTDNGDIIREEPASYVTEAERFLKEKEA